MAPKRKAKGNAAARAKEKKQNMGTDEFMQHVRNDANKKLGCGLRKKERLEDVDHAVKTIRAIMGTNKDIWERCSSGENGPIKKGKFVFKRVGFTKVRVKTSSVASSGSLAFKAVPEFQTKDFGSPPEVPVQLAAIINPTLDNGGIFVDYEKYLETVLLLNEDTLLPFLSGMKKHLEDVQIFLGEIDEWLMAASFCIDFITETFGTKRDKLKPPILSGCQARSCTKNHAGLTCVKCYKACSNSVLHSCSSTCGSHHSYFHPIPVSLMSQSTSGTHDHKFDITKEAEHDKLKKFLDFVSA